MPKVLKWVSKQKFEIEELFNDCHLTIANVFDFKIPKSQRPDTDIIREELCELKKEKQTIMRDQKLFEHYFFNFWKEKAREMLLEKAYLMDSIVESPVNLYNICEGVAFNEESYSLL